MQSILIVTLALHVLARSEAHGELESAYKPDAVLGNLERIWGRNRVHRPVSEKSMTTSSLTARRPPATEYG